MTTKANSSIFTTLVLVAIAVAATMVGGLWLITDQTIRSTLDENARGAVDVDLAGLVDIYASGGIDELESRISDRLALVPANGTRPHYLLLGPEDTRIAGDIGGWPQLDASISERGAFQLGENTQVVGRATLLDSDVRLLVAHELGDHQSLLQRVGFVFLAGGGLFILLVGSAARLAASKLQRRIERINLAFQTSDIGNMPVPSRSRKADEVDELTAHAKAAIQRVQRLMESYRDTSDQVAHEIRTPLMHLDTRLSKALESLPSGNAGQEIAGARHDIRQIVTMLEGLLDIAASHARRGDLGRLKQVDLSAICERVCDLYAGSAEESNHVFSWNIEPGIVISAESDQITRLVTNLLDNAFKYVPPGGKIELALEQGPVLSVADDGPGIAKHDREHIFDRFYRSAGGAENGGGAGLGLALVKAIAHRHGLTIRLDPEHKGARFVVEQMEEG